MKKSRYHDMSNDEIREFMSMSGYRILYLMIAQEYGREIDLDTVRKRKPV